MRPRNVLGLGLVSHVQVLENGREPLLTWEVVTKICLMLIFRLMRHDMLLSIGIWVRFFNSRSRYVVIYSIFELALFFLIRKNIRGVPLNKWNWALILKKVSTTSSILS